MEQRVYISHSRQNTGVTLRLYEELSKRGIKMWLDSKDMGSGSDWKQEIKRAIKAARAFVFLIGPAGLHDEIQRLEWHQVAEGEYYQDPNKAMIPVLIGNPELPGFLSDRHALQIDDSPVSISAAAENIIAALDNPSSTIDAEKQRHGKAARKSFFEGVLQESMDLLKGSR